MKTARRRGREAAGRPRVGGKSERRSGGARCPLNRWRRGVPKLTHGFCSRELAKHIPARTDPSRDQHAAHELDTRGQPICRRLGAAADFFVPYESMLEVAQWVVANTPFHRLYFYGDHRPIHVSVGPESTRQVVLMRPAKGGRRILSVIDTEKFLALDGAAIRTMEW